jgi:hypothetical protein
MTYAVNRETYAVVPYFLFFSKRVVPEYHHALMHDYYAGWEVGQFDEGCTALGFLRNTASKIIQLWRFYIGPAFLLPLIALPWSVRDRRMRLPLFAGAIFCLGWLVETWTFPHYVAPATGLIYLVLVQCMRHQWHWLRAGRPIGTNLVRAIPLLACTMILLRVAAAWTHLPIEPAWPHGNMKRAAILHQLRQLPDSHLVIVRYGFHHDFDRDWVYNEADINSAKVVWARDMGKNNNQELLGYFRDRRVWVVEGDDPAPQLRPYSN